jgi:putative phosphoribosyl transferase
LRALRKSRPKWLVLAVPVAAPDTASRLRDECDELICLLTPEPFYAVGAHFLNFYQTSDHEVVRLLAQSDAIGASPSPLRKIADTAARFGPAKVPGDTWRLT